MSGETTFLLSVQGDSVHLSPEFPGPRSAVECSWLSLNFMVCATIVRRELSKASAEMATALGRRRSEPLWDGMEIMSGRTSIMECIEALKKDRSAGRQPVLSYFCPLSRTSSHPSDVQRESIEAKRTLSIVVLVAFVVLVVLVLLVAYCQ